MKLLALYGLLLANICWAGSSIVVVVHKDNPVTALSKREVMDLYMGRMQYFPQGGKALPIDYEAENNPIKEQFYRALVNRTVAQVNAYWARVVFTGKASPPYPLPSAQQVQAAVASNLSALGYVYADQVGESVKVVAHLTESTP